MPRPKGKTNSSTPRSDSATAGATVFFRDIFMKRRKLLTTRSNDKVLKMWLKSHPDFEEVPDNVKSSLANVKSVLRSKLHLREAEAAAEEAASPTTALKKAPAAALAPEPNAVDTGLEKLEIMIDECMNMARHLGIKHVDDILRALRMARRKVVWKLGEV